MSNFIYLSPSLLLGNNVKHTCHGTTYKIEFRFLNH